MPPKTGVAWYKSRYSTCGCATAFNARPYAPQKACCNNCVKWLEKNILPRTTRNRCQHDTHKAITCSLLHKNKWFHLRAIPYGSIFNEARVPAERSRNIHLSAQIRAKRHDWFFLDWQPVAPSDRCPGKDDFSSPAMLPVRMPGTK